jgi:hypothetical protein
LIRDALEYLRLLTTQANGGEIIDTPDGKFWSHGGNLDPMPLERNQPKPGTLYFATLASLADYVTKDVDDLADSHHAFHVSSPNSVDYITTVYKPTGQRFVRAAARAIVPTERFGSWMPQDEAVIWLQTCFAETQDRARLLAAVGKLKKEAVRQQDDDGVTQTVTVRAGISTVGTQDIANPYFLAPYRTFSEVEQPASAFLLRIQEGRTAMDVALFEADGGRWMLEAVSRVGAALRALVGTEPVILV